MKLSQNEQKALECLTSLDGLLDDLNFFTACDWEFQTNVKSLIGEIKDKQHKLEHPIVFMNAFFEGEDVRLDINQDETDSTSLQRFISCYPFWDGKQWRASYGKEDFSQWTFFYIPIKVFCPSLQEVAKTWEEFKTRVLKNKPKITDVQTFCMIPERDEWGCLYVEDGKIKYAAMYVTHAEANRTANELWEKAKENE